jgi:hypothetical protein
LTYRFAVYFSSSLFLAKKNTTASTPPRGHDAQRKCQMYGIAMITFDVDIFITSRDDADDLSRHAIHDAGFD